MIQRELWDGRTPGESVGEGDLDWNHSLKPAGRRHSYNFGPTERLSTSCRSLK